MNKLLRRGMSLAMVAGLVAVPATIPALAQDGGEASISHRQSVLTQLSSTGELDTSRVFTQLTVTGDGPVEVVLPSQSTRGLRDLGGLGRPSTDGDDVVYGIDATSAGVHKRTVATNTADLPVSVAVAYEFDGEPIEDPGDVVGRSGELSVSYTVRNETVEPQELDVFNARQEPTTETVDVGVPMVGTISLPLDNRFSDIRADGANVAGDGRGNTLVNFSLVLFEPLGSFEETVTWSAQVTDATLPDTNLQLAPVTSDSFKSLPDAQSAYSDTFVGLQTITDGAVRIDMTMAAILDGASELLDGMNQLADGSQELSTGLESAASGSQDLADGTGEAAPGAEALADGVGRISAGAGELADGTGALSQGAQQLRAGVNDLASGAGQVAGGLEGALAGAVTIRDGLAGVSGGLPLIHAGVSDVRDAVNDLEGDLAVGLEDAIAENLGPALEGSLVSVLSGYFQNPATLGLPQAQADALAEAYEPHYDAALNASLVGYLEAAIGVPTATAEALAGGFAGVYPQSLAPVFAQQFSPAFALGYQEQVTAGFAPGFAQLLGGLSNPACDPEDPQNEANPCGLIEVAGLLGAGQSDLVDGLEQLAGGAVAVADGAGSAHAGSQELAGGAVQVDDGTQSLAAGSGEAASGANDLADGLAQIDTGANQLADGLGDARDGSGELATGMGDARDGGESVVGAMDELQEFGTNKILNDVSRAGLQPDRLLKQARAADDRAKAGEGLPYATADGADASAVYQFEIAGVGGDEGASTPVRAGAAVLAFGAAAALGLGVRRRLI